jgi:hypothetical protein
MTDRAKSEYYADTIASIARWHAQAGFTDPSNSPNPLIARIYTLKTRMDVAESDRYRAWYLDSCHAVLASPDPKVAVRALVQAASYKDKADLHGTAEHDLLHICMLRIEALVDGAL